VAARGDDVQARRVEATFAELHARRGSPACLVIAERALAGMGAGPLFRPDALWARARLGRVSALAAIVVEGDRSPRPWRLLDGAVRDYREAGFDAEAALCGAEVRAAAALATGDGIDQAHHAVGECLAVVRLLDSTYLDLLIAHRIFLDFAIGDLAQAHAGAAEVDRIAGVRTVHPGARVHVDYVRLVLRLAGEGPTPAVVDAVEAHLATVRSAAGPEVPGHLVGLASALVDSGRVGPADLELARRWATQAAATGQPVVPSIGRDLAALLTRLDLLERPDQAAVAAIDADLDAGRRLGLRRDVAQRALRAALAARRAGLDEVAERLHRDAVADLPPPSRRLLWENAYAALVEVPAAREAPAPAGTRLRLLGPEVTVEVGSSSRPLGDALARLVVALVADGGAATADRLIDVLWPDADPDAGRTRLRVALHRLRRALRGAGGGGGGDGRADGRADPVQRRGATVALAPHVDVDALAFEKLAAQGGDERDAALDLYGGDVAHVQLAYDDVAAPLRRRLARLWRQLAGEALADPRTSRARALGIAAVARPGAEVDPDLDELRRAAEARL
jgi:hypothetical protein